MYISKRNEIANKLFMRGNFSDLNLNDGDEERLEMQATELQEVYFEKRLYLSSDDDVEAINFNDKLFDDLKKEIEQSAKEMSEENNIFEKGTTAQKIALFRKRNFLTQFELAEKINATQKDISRWETGDRNPKTDKLILIAKALNCDITDLI